MKRKKQPERDALVLHDKSLPYNAERIMVRTQIYLTRAEHDFLSREAGRRGEPMSAFLRGIIDEKMRIPNEAWTNNPMLEPTPDVPGWEGPEDGSINHDHYVYGCPKEYEKKKGEWVRLPPNK
jgi:hypothetical protein